MKNAKERSGAQAVKTDEKRKFFSVKQARTMVISGVALALVCITAALIIWSQTDAYDVTTYSMGEYVQQTLYGKNQEAAARETANRIADLENLISWRIPDSDIGKLNANAGGVFQEVDAVTWQILTLCKEVYTQSGGAFDCTIFPLSRLWNFDGDQQFVPTQAQVESALADVDAGKLLLQEGNTAALKSGSMAIDLGAVEKGAACDVAVKTYEEMNAGSGIVAVGSSIGVYGTKFGGTPWKIAVQDPASDSAMGELRLTEGFVSTSGSYEKEFEQDSVRYHHLLDPKTGYPADTGLLSVTVQAGSGALSDALAAACFVLGAEKSQSLLKKYHAQAIFLTKENQVIATAGMRENFRIVNNEYSWAEADRN